jgi:hypothetical protein
MNLISTYLAFRELNYFVNFIFTYNTRTDGIYVHLLNEQKKTKSV